jgi:hypothetical protein
MKFPTGNRLRGVAPYIGLTVLFGWWVFALSDRTLFDAIVGAAICVVTGCIIFLGRRRAEAMDFRRK